MSFNRIMRSFFEDGYARGVAIGRADIHTDTIVFRYKSEVQAFPTIKVADLAKRNGTFYELPLDQFRKMKNG